MLKNLTLALFAAYANGIIDGAEDFLNDATDIAGDAAGNMEDTSCIALVSSDLTNWNISGLAKDVPTGDDGLVESANYGSMYTFDIGGNAINWNYCK